MSNVVIEELVNPCIRIVHVVLAIFDLVVLLLRTAKDLSNIVWAFDTSRCEAVDSSRQVDNQTNYDQHFHGFNDQISQKNVVDWRHTAIKVCQSRDFICCNQILAFGEDTLLHHTACD